MRPALALALLVMATTAAAQLPPADVPLNDTRCGTECVRCAADGCIKCARLLVWPGGTCTHSCPSGSREAWAHDDHLMGRVCYPANTYNEVIVGGACGAVVCVLLVVAGATYARCRSGSRTRSQPLPQPGLDDDTRLREFHKQLDCLRCDNDSCVLIAGILATHAGPDDDTRLRNVHKQLDCLRPHAYTLLAILNHTRHQVRELYQLGNNDAAMAYSCVMSDLAKLLILLNKQQVPVVPEEWPRLASWAERILKRYSRNPLPQQPPEHQLVNFLSPPSQSSDSDTHQSFSTFKPPSYSPTSYDSTDKELEIHWDVRPPSYSQIEREKETIVLSDPWERRPIVRRESVWLEDELFEMTRRPQDELTTEL